ncbi:mediator of RNA polymerase II transcription subunit 15a [Selaginella moellendorffii]|uniref:mediator of RNA polymerase II transcription subunit 15a n=1 Tax=Selaginella moellendorffii TaxID=88036 RepID=UPI000D1CACA4|nr:mediator of RNA polymerase II transcription subunit 15a [Selaginella moellendorffii]|eukprot:XP_002963734.2 mediator of RNA polymerase II transcription subunit 15a [Selaginella moellendorffii]
MAWRSGDERKKMVKRMMGTLHKQFHAPGGINELFQIASRLEDAVYKTATDEQDYHRKITAELVAKNTTSDRAQVAPGSSSLVAQQAQHQNQIMQQQQQLLQMRQAQAQVAQSSSNSTMQAQQVSVTQNPAAMRMMQARQQQQQQLYRMNPQQGLQQAASLLQQQQHLTGLSSQHQAASMLPPGAQSFQQQQLQMLQHQQQSLPLGMKIKAETPSASLDPTIDEQEAAWNKLQILKDKHLPHFQQVWDKLCVRKRSLPADQLPKLDYYMNYILKFIRVLSLSRDNPPKKFGLEMVDNCEKQILHTLKKNLPQQQQQQQPPATNPGQNAGPHAMHTSNQQQQASQLFQQQQQQQLKMLEDSKMGIRGMVDAKRHRARSAQPVPSPQTFQASSPHNVKVGSPVTPPHMTLPPIEEDDSDSKAAIQSTAPPLVLSPGISASPFLDLSASPAQAADPAGPDPLERLLKIVRTMSPKALSAGAREMASIVYLSDRLAATGPGPGCTAAVGEDLAAMTNSRERARALASTRGKPNSKRPLDSLALTVISPDGSVSNSLDGGGEADLESPEVISGWKRQKLEISYVLEQEIRDTNDHLIDTVVDISEDGSEEAASEGKKGLVLTFTYIPDMAVLPPLRVFVPPTYPEAPLFMSDHLDPNSNHSLLAVAREALTRALDYSRPVTVRAMARAWDECARKAVSAVSGESDRDSILSSTGTWIDCAAT